MKNHIHTLTACKKKTLSVYVFDLLLFAISTSLLKKRQEAYFLGFSEKNTFFWKVMLFNISEFAPIDGIHG